jgi:hypothetical protein
MRTAILVSILEDQPAPYDPAAGTLYGRTLAESASVHVDGDRLVHLCDGDQTGNPSWYGGDVRAATAEPTAAEAVASLTQATGEDVAAIVG